MDFSQTMRAIARRWYVAVPAFLLVVGLAGLIVVVTPHDYESTGTVVLSEPDPKAALEHHTLGHDQVANPLLGFADSLSTDSQLLIQSLNSPAAAQQLVAKGGTATYTASDGDLDGPFIVVTANAPTPDRVTGTVTLAMQYVRDQLLQRQQALGAPKSSYILVKDVVTPTQPMSKHGGKSRYLAVTAILAWAGSLCAVFAVETVSRRRRTRTA
ncbi:MAG TPA: hypothetical protein VFW65_36605 [Pseudonocardiaceae bacterium]|nr:hypothetical protein [Pseudonocardiaceae bacterium]